MATFRSGVCNAVRARKYGSTYIEAKESTGTYAYAYERTSAHVFFSLFYFFGSKKHAMAAITREGRTVMIVESAVSDLSTICVMYEDFFKGQNDYALGLDKIRGRISTHTIAMSEDVLHCLFSATDPLGIVIVEFEQEEIARGSDDLVIYRGNRIDFSLRERDQPTKAKAIKYVVFPAVWEYTFRITSRTAKLFSNIECTNAYSKNTRSSSIAPVSSLLYVRDGALGDHECGLFLELYRNHLHKTHGVTGGGYNREIKDTREVLIPKDALYSWILHDNLSIHVTDYIERFPFPLKDAFGEKGMFVSQLQIQRYESNEGHFKRHIDAMNTGRMLVVMWYLKDVGNGGETVFHCGTDHETKVSPKKGTVVIFPATYTFVHAGQTPVDCAKYIITGWIYLPNDVRA